MADSVFHVPESRIIRIYSITGENKTIEITPKEGRPPLVLEDESLQMSFSSSFSPLLGNFLGKAGDFIKLADQVFKWGISGFKEQGFQKWDSTEPARLTFTGSLYRSDNAYYDVVLPAKELISCGLPFENEGGGLSPPGPSIADALSENQKIKDILTEIGSNELIKQFSENFRGNDGESQTSENGKSVPPSRKYILKIGNMFSWPNIIFNSIEPNWSTDADETGKSIWCKLQFQVSSIYIPTNIFLSNMIGEF